MGLYSYVNRQCSIATALMCSELPRLKPSTRAESLQDGVKKSHVLHEMPWNEIFYDSIKNCATRVSSWLKAGIGAFAEIPSETASFSLVHSCIFRCYSPTGINSSSDNNVKVQITTDASIYMLVISVSMSSMKLSHCSFYKFGSSKYWQFL